ncbi:MAG: hypothetical protein AABW63_02720 [Nanoarchaeota archaeon]
MADNILQSPVLTNFIYPFLLIFFIAFAILEKTKIFGSDKKQVNAFTALVIGLIFVGAIFPKYIVTHLVLFLSVGLVIVFVVLLLWGFITGGEAKFEGKGIKIGAGIVVILAVLIAMFLITGIWDDVINALFKQSWSTDVWSNIILVVLIAAALAVVLMSGKGGKGK